MSKLGEGGVCRVDEACDMRGGRVALKRLLEDKLESANGRLILRNEAAALLRLRHPGVPRHITSSFDGPDPFIAMELITGEHFAPGRGMDFSRCSVLSTAISICDILATIHEQGIVHRDIKPSNIMIRRRTLAPVVVDFGFAKLSGVPDYAKQVDLFIGSPKFVAPEQTYVRAEVDTRADIYSLGVILYCYLSGHYPYYVPPTSDLQKILNIHRYEEAPFMHQRDSSIPRNISHIVARAMAKDPEKRFGDVRELADALSDCLDLI